MVKWCHHLEKVPQTFHGVSSTGLWPKVRDFKFIWYSSHQNLHKIRRLLHLVDSFSEACDVFWLLVFLVSFHMGIDTVFFLEWGFALEDNSLGELNAKFHFGLLWALDWLEYLWSSFPCHEHSMSPAIGGWFLTMRIPPSVTYSKVWSLLLAEDYFMVPSRSWLIEFIAT